MAALLDNFGLAAALSAIVVLATGTAVVITIAQARKRGRPTLRPAARVLAVGSACLILAATAVPFSWPLQRDGSGDLVLEIGRGGLGQLQQVLASPGTLQSVLLIANVALYVPLTLSAAIGWPTRGATILVAALLLSLSVEALQFLVLDRVAATDDVILNTSGAVIGLALGILIRRHMPPD